MKNCITPDPNKIVIDYFDKRVIRYYESVMTQSNGYMGIRGNFEESYEQGGLKGTYLAGVWFPDKTRVGWWKNGYPEYFGKAIHAVDYIGIKALVDGHQIDLSKDAVTDFRYVLDMNTAILSRTVTAVTPAGRVRLQSSRFLSCVQKELCCIEYSVCPLDRSADVTLIPFLDFNIRNEDSNYHETFWEIRSEKCFTDGGYVEAKTKPNGFGTERFTVGAAMSVLTDPEPLIREDIIYKGYVGKKIAFQIGRGEQARIEKLVAVTTSRDYPDDSIEKRAVMLLKNSVNEGYSKLQLRHQQFFSLRMQSCDVQLEGDVKAQQGIRYNLFQLLCTYSGEDPRLNIGPKGFSGEKYGGAAYWDTEAFLVPFYLGVSEPKVTRNLLLYRYNTLEKAKRNAAKLGLKGALYPMVTFDGNECHNEWEITFEEIHRNGAIAYAIFNYVTYTGDEQYLIDFGFQVLLEISRFWISRVHYCKSRDAWLMHGVTGPNEYENNVCNNWYTNRIAKWCLCYTADMADKYEGILKEEYSRTELERFRTVSENLYLPYDPEHQIFLQQDNFLDKELLTADQIKPEERPICQHWSWDRILRSCFIKQADVVHGLYVLHDYFGEEVIRRNFAFYEPMTVHESSLSAGVHSVVASRAGLYQKAYEMFLKTMRLDLDDINNDTSDGLHITSMSGAWLGLTQGFAGIKTTREKLELAPYLPEPLTGYSFKLHYRGRLLQINVDSERVHITKLSGDELMIVLYDKAQILSDSIEADIQTISHTGTIRCAIFDLDGVLTDTARYHYLAWRKLAEEEWGFVFTQAANEAFKGVDRITCMQLLSKMLGKSMNDSEIQYYAALKNNHYLQMIEGLSPMNLKPGVIHVLNNFREKGLKIAVASASKNTRRILAKTGIHQYFDVIIDGERVRRPKPDPECFIKAAETFGLDHGSCLVFEDSQASIDSAAAIGFHCISIGNRPMNNTVAALDGFTGFAFDALLQQLQKYLTNSGERRHNIHNATGCIK